MAFWDGLLGGGGDPLDIYGDLFTDKQKAALQQRSSSEGLLRMAGAFGQAAQPSRMPTSFMGALGQAAGAMAGHGDEATKTALEGMKTAEGVRASRQKRAGQERYRQIVEAALRASGIDPASPQGQQATQQALATLPDATLAAPPGQTTSAAAADAPVPAPQPPPGAPQLNAIGMPPPQDLSRFGIPPRPGMPSAVPPGMPGIDAPYGAPPAPQQNTGLLPPQDQVVGPDGQPLQGQGVFPSMLASLTGGAPNGGLPFRLASSTPTSAATPGAAGGDDWQRVKPLIRKYESGGRNIEQGVVGPQGGYNPSVGRVTGPSSASGYYQMIDPTWRAAARKVGIDTDKYPRAINAPEELQDRAAEALYREQGLAPWAPYNKALAAATGYQGGGQDVVIPSGRGIPRSALTNVADISGGPGAGAGGAGQVIPGLNLTPQQLGLLNALGKLNDIDSPFDSLLETYYKSPGYLGEAETARTKARTAIEDPLNQRMEILKFNLQMRKDGFIVGDDGKVAEDPEWAKIHTRRTDETESLKAKYQEQVQTRTKDHEEKITIRQEQRADAREIVQAPVYGPDGRIVMQEMPRGEKVERLKNQTMTPGGYKPGDIIAKPVGDPPPEHQWQMTPQGELKAVPVPGSPAATKATEVTRTQEMADRTLLRARDIMNEDATRIENYMKTSALPVTGFWGSLLSAAPGTPQHDTAVTIKAIQARTSLDSINATRAATGSTGLGQITMGEHAMLSSAVAALTQSQTKEAFLINLRRVKDEYNNLISSPAFRGTMPPTTTVVPPQAPSGLPPGYTDTGKRHQGKPIVRAPDGREGTMQ